MADLKSLRALECELREQLAAHEVAHAVGCAAHLVARSSCIVLHLHQTNSKYCIWSVRGACAMLFNEVCLEGQGSMCDTDKHLLQLRSPLRAHQLEFASILLLGKFATLPVMPVFQD
jgi:hypothetical protein